MLVGICTLHVFIIFKDDERHGGDKNLFISLGVFLPATTEINKKKRKIG